MKDYQNQIPCLPLEPLERRLSARLMKICSSWVLTRCFPSIFPPASARTLDVARTAAAETQSIPVTVVDAGQLSLGTGFMVEAAARAAQKGLSLQDIQSMLVELGKRTHVFAALDTLEFLRRSGRMNGVVAGIGSLLQIKPLLKMHQGTPTSERVRTSDKAIERLIELLSDLQPLERVALVHTNAADKARELYQRVRDILPEGEVLSVDITPVIGTHIGPGAVGFACISA